MFDLSSPTPVYACQLNTFFVSVSSLLIPAVGCGLLLKAVATLSVVGGRLGFIVVGRGGSSEYCILASLWDGGFQL